MYHAEASHADAPPLAATDAPPAPKPAPNTETETDPEFGTLPSRSLLPYRLLTEASYESDSVIEPTPPPAVTATLSVLEPPAAARHFTWFGISGFGFRVSGVGILGRGFN